MSRAAVNAMFAVLAEERTAIRTLDASGVERAAQEKESLATAIASMGETELGAMQPELRALRLELRRNGVLLAHARACLREITAHSRLNATV